MAVMRCGTIFAVVFRFSAVDVFVEKFSNVVNIHAGDHVMVVLVKQNQFKEVDVDKSVTNLVIVVIHAKLLVMLENPVQQHPARKPLLCIVHANAAVLPFPVASQLKNWNVTQNVTRLLALVLLPQLLD